MKFVKLCFTVILLSSCGGGGTVPEKPQQKTFNSVDLRSVWNVSIKIPECDTPFNSTYSFRTTNSRSLLNVLIINGNIPNVDNIAACGVVGNDAAITITPYTSQQKPIQFIEMLSKKLAWKYDSLTIVEFKTDLIEFDRVVSLQGIGNRTWTYTLIKSKSVDQLSSDVIVPFAKTFAVTATKVGCSTIHSGDLLFTYFAIPNKKTFRIQDIIISGIMPSDR